MKTICYRPGNIVWDFAGAGAFIGFKYEVITEITSKGIRCESGKKMPVGEANPVKVSSGILLKAGFATHGYLADSYYILLENMSPTDTPMPSMVWVNGNLFIESGDRQIQMPIWDKSIRGEIYLHELQNLYRDLNGEDLPIDLNDL